MDGRAFNVSGDRVNIGGTQINSGNTIRVGGSLKNSGNLSVGNQTIAAPAGVNDALVALRRYAELSVPPEETNRLVELTKKLADDMAVAEPDRKSAAERLTEIAEVIRGSNSALNAGTSLVDSLVKIAKWIGPLAAGVLAGFGIVL
jgi:hypothetical protein